MILRKRHLRLAGFAGLAWIVLESLLFYVSVGAIGVFPTLALLTLKGIGGLFLLVISLRWAFRGMAIQPGRRGLGGAASALFSAAGALLILVPGFASTLLGLALFSPSLRAALTRLLWREKKRGGREAIVTLDPGEWREVSVRKPRRPRKSRSIAP